MDLTVQKKQYLGDSVYIELEEFENGPSRYILTTENGDAPSNKIYLEPEVVDELIRFVQASKISGGDYWVTVCATCLTASCWHGELMCCESKNACTIEKRASELKALDLENPYNYSREKLLEVCGEVRECKPPF